MIDAEGGLTSGLSSLAGLFDRSGWRRKPRGVELIELRRANLSGEAMALLQQANSAGF